MCSVWQGQIRLRHLLISPLSCLQLAAPIPALRPSLFCMHPTETTNTTSLCFFLSLFVPLPTTTPPCRDEFLVATCWICFSIKFTLRLSTLVKTCEERATGTSQKNKKNCKPFPIPYFSCERSGGGRGGVVMGRIRKLDRIIGGLYGFSIGVAAREDTPGCSWNCSADPAELDMKGAAGETPLNASPASLSGRLVPAAPIHILLHWIFFYLFIFFNFFTVCYWKLVRR